MTTTAISETELFERVLDKGQLADWERCRGVLVRGSLGGLYEVGVNWDGMLAKIDQRNGLAIGNLCVAASPAYGVGARMIALVLTLHADESRVIRVGRRYAAYPNAVRRAAPRWIHRLGDTKAPADPDIQEHSLARVEWMWGC